MNDLERAFLQAVAGRVHAPPAVWHTSVHGVEMGEGRNPFHLMTVTEWLP